MLTIELPLQADRTKFNVQRWAALLADPELTKFEGRIETDRHGHIIMSPPPAPAHGSFQAEIAFQLRNRLSHGRVLTECPVSTADGVKAADVAWASPERMEELCGRPCFVQAPEICVEVLSPANSDAEIQEKTALYFDAGAVEVWLCDLSGRMKFIARDQGASLEYPKLCPGFPKRIEFGG